MVYRIFAAAFLGSVATSASAEPVWGKVEFGMTRAQVEALYPKGPDTEYQKAAIEISNVNIMGKCDAEANIRFDDAGIVKEVMIAGNPSMGGRCSNEVMTALSAKYGQPANWDGNGGSILARQGKVAIWSRPDGVAMRFKKYENGIFGGGGLAKASWELTYSKVDANFGL
ncbi:hypothetical protein [Sphingomonas yantingensis]|uniref:DUF3617 domain-containing protein n=1 Tax=Sphingomonas yantingensis TaxID=1241761 RepID=A0A7W9AQ62_9SPHN|nr:hypothetical protein [Sphingomonas yantingensis]MBB5698515.1 hypothetical protein [Sphingomonas yantingensis]